jgi:hypothetical protein
VWLAARGEIVMVAKNVKFTGILLQLRLRAALERMAVRNGLSLSEQMRRLLLIGVAQELVNGD